MSLLDVILNSQDGAAVQQLAGQFGLPPEQAHSALSALLPALASGLQQNMTREGGLDSLVAALSTGTHGRYLDNPASLGEAASSEDGNGILAHVLGNKDASRQVAQQAAAQTGIDPGLLKQMLPLVAAMAMGGLSRVASPAVAGGGAPAAGGGLMAALGPLLDQNRDGSVMDDVVGLAGRLLGGKA